MRRRSFQTAVAVAQAGRAMPIVCRPRAASPVEDMQALFERLADQYEAGNRLAERPSPVFFDGDEDEW